MNTTDKFVDNNGPGECPGFLTGEGFAGRLNLDRYDARNGRMELGIICQPRGI